MSTPPTIVSYTETVWDTSPASKTSAVVQYQANDLIVCLGGDEGTIGLTLPTAPGLVFTNVIASAVSALFCGARIDVARPNQAGAVAITQTPTGARDYGFGVWVFRNSGGIGNSAEQHTATQTVDLSAQQADSVMVYGIFDWSASAVVSVVPTPTHVRQAVQGTNYTFYVDDMSSPGTTEAVAYGLSAGSGPFTIVAAEVKGVPYDLYAPMAVQQRM